ncbi:penicillin-binding transpeptidase domain-containing protein [Salipaludibacillus sp. CF4.18]|uniref:penicillin-binding transpeptidase domain-containing protein n=1 Tax=Salipaludibacillus sp. CF4.18 TaxID=3373081 RepID=UPI003EE44FC9
MNRLGILIVFSVMGAMLFGCANEEEMHPEEPLEDYLTAWESESFTEMLDVIGEESKQMIANEEWSFEERYEKMYADMGIENIELNFEARNFEEEEIDLEEEEQITYPVQVSMDSIIGELNSNIEVDVSRVTRITENKEEIKEWEVAWDPSHMMIGIQEISDVVNIDILDPIRGEIFDRNGEGLAINGEVYSGEIVPEISDDVEESAITFAEIMDLDEEQTINLANRFPDHPDWPASIQRLAMTDERSEELLAEVDGILLDKVEGRVYPHGDITGHIIGYTGPITAEELEEYEGEGYTTTSYLGKDGLEDIYEERLKGTAGVSVTIETEDGETREFIGDQPEVDGEDIHLTLDVVMQRKMAETLGEDTGAGVVMHPKTGEVLAMVSEPAFDSNLRYLQLSDPRAENLEDTAVLFEKRFQHTYSPGSIFKPFTAIAGLEEGQLDPTEKLTIEGLQWQPEDSGWGGYKVTRVNDRETNIDLTTAMTLSDNIYFAQQALRLGGDSFEAWGERYGFGEEFPFDFPLYHSTLTNEGFDTEILLADTGYGQGQVQASPIHMVALYTVFLNDGAIVQPKLFQETEEKLFQEAIASSETISTVRDTLVEVVQNSNGTANRANPGHDRSLAGKTGTAELKMDQSDEEGEQIGWFVSFDTEEEDLLTTIMVKDVQDKGGSGYVVDLTNKFYSKLAE